MAQVELKWDRLPPRWQDINAFIPRIMTIMGAKFLPSDGFDHEMVGKTEYRVRRGFFHGLDVRVWRQGEDLILNVSPGSRLSSLLPGIAALAALFGIGYLEIAAGEQGYPLPWGTLPKSSAYVELALGTVLFALLWGLLGVLTRPFVGRMKQGCDSKSVLTEITRGFSEG